MNRRIVILALALGLGTLILPRWTPAQPGADERADRSSLAARIDEAIDRGVCFLLDRQQRDGSWPEFEETFPTGQTAFSVYTLLRSGVPPAHPSVKRGIAHLLEVRPVTTYVAACHLMAFGAVGDEKLHPRMRVILKDLLSWQTRSGAWGYPDHRSRRVGGEPDDPGDRRGPDGGRPPGPGGRRGPGGPREPQSRRGGDEWVDLSNTQYATLGLRAARMAGLKVPAAVWARLAEAVLTFRGAEERAQAAMQPGQSRTYRMPVRGFRYVPHPQGHAVTGSMTAAGVSILGICREALGRRGGKIFDRATQHAIDRGTNWLAARFSVRENPGTRQWHYYYLYGLERVGSILRMEKIGAHAWYPEGAKYLVDHQSRFGEWQNQGVESATCFALLFLRRASQATVRAETRRSDRFVADGPDYTVGIRGFGRWPLRVWLCGFCDHVIEKYGVDVAGRKRLRVARIEYLMDDEVIASVKGDARRPWANESYPATHHFTRPGRHRISARVHLVAPAVPMGSSEPTVTVEAEGFTVRMRDVLEPWMIPVAEAGARAQAKPRKVKARASSSFSPRFEGERAADGRESTAWICRRDDTTPTLILAWSRAVTADRIRIGQAAGRTVDAGGYDRVRELEVRVNGSARPIRVEADPDPIRPIEVKLRRATRIRQLSITIVRRDSEGRRPGRVGLSEIYLTRG